MKKKGWKSCVKEVCYCRPALNKHLLCIRRSLLEVCRILNSGCGHRDRNGRK